MIRHIKKWLIWRKHCKNSSKYKFLVLIGFVKSPSMTMMSLKEDWKPVTSSFGPKMEDTPGLMSSLKCNCCIEESELHESN